jgi:diguanylate cyclase (GGDEF)-like protein
MRPVSSESFRGTWLCPTQFDRSRLLDMEARLAAARTVMYAAVAVALIICGPLLGWWTLAPVAVVVGTYKLLQPRISTADRPEYVVATTVVIAQLQIGMGVALTGGPTSPLLILLLLPIVTLPARFGGRGLQAGIVLTIAIIVAATVVPDPVAFQSDPEYAVLSIAALFGLGAFADALMRAEVESRSDSAQDALTGLMNRKALATQFTEVARQAELTGRCVCMVLIDLDRFKAVNDDNGHAVGDAVLRAAAGVLRGNLRSFELVYRVGGEEFLVLMPGVDRQGGRVVAERLCSAMHAARPAGLVVTASFGVAVAHGAAVAFDPLFDAADQALYAAKRGGRNQVVVAPDIRPAVADAPSATAAGVGLPGAIARA